MLDITPPLYLVNFTFYESTAPSLKNAVLLVDVIPWRVSDIHKRKVGSANGGAERVN